MDENKHPSHRRLISCNQNIFLLLIFIGLIIFYQISDAQDDPFIERQDLIWAKFAGYGYISKAKGIEYMIELRTEYKTSDNILDVLIFRPAIYYYVTPHVSLWLGYALREDFPDHEDDLGELENRIWEQISWGAVENNHYSIYTRTRLEQRELTTDPQWAWRLRQKQTLKLYYFTFKSIVPYLADEILLNLNSPEWVGLRFVNQNRFYFGFEIPFNQFTKYEIRYLNQVQFGIPKNRMNHVIYLKLSTRL